MHTSTLGSSVRPLPAWKRILDLSCCFVALPFLALASIAAFIITRFASPGPIFFRQERIGYRGQRFFLYKFRTMHVSASVTTHQVHLSQLMKSNVPMQKLDSRGDSRLFPGGWLLRASGIDELPQIINVLRGEMTLVGPRPCIQYEFDQYTEQQRERLNCVPGLTGLWQVSGKNRTTFEEMVRLDVEYGKRMSLAQDVGIMLRTVPALWTQISDTRAARKGATPAAQPAAATSGMVSATFLANSQNVVVAPGQQVRRFVGRPATQLAFEGTTNSRTMGQPANRTEPHG